MFKHCIALCVLFSTNAFCQKNATTHYKCRFEWQTMSEALIAKEKVVRDIVDLEINKQLTVALDLRGKYPLLKVKENYKDSKSNNYLEYSFSCTRNLSCQGSRINMYEGKADKTEFSTPASPQRGIGGIDGREIFFYENGIDSDFNFNYILYKDETGKPLGLKVSCKK